MKPESRSQRLLSITQSKAKMYEYNVPVEDHIDVPIDPARLFPLSISILGDVAARINDGESTNEEILELQGSLPFSARFFDAFVEAHLNQEIAPYVRLLGSAAYYLCSLPGSSKILARRISNNDLNLDGLGLENLLTWLLIGEFSIPLPDVSDNLYRNLIDTVYVLHREFSNSGSQIDAVFEATRQLRTLAYDLGTPRQLLLADLIGAIVHLKFQNSTWNCLPKYSNLALADWFSVIQKETFIKEFWPAQHLLGEKGVFRGKSAVVQMPTSAGKTKATEIIIRSAFLTKQTSLAVIVAPFRALCHEIRQSLLRAFQNESIFVDELSDVLQMDVSVEIILRDQQVLISTPEKFNYVLRHAPELAQKIGLIIYDEGHQFDNGTRGITYELLLTSLKARIPDTAQIILISAVITNAHQIGQWLIGDDAEIVEGSMLIPTFRSIGFSTIENPRRNLYFVNPSNPDEREFYVPRIFNSYPLIKSKKTFPDYSKGNEIALFLGLKLSNQGSIAIFSGTKESVSKMCETVVNAFKRGLSIPAPVDFANQEEVQKLKYLHDSNLGPNSVMAESAQFGIFAHHNNVPHGLRLSIEYAIKEGLANFVICISTLAQGVNLPIRYLIVTSVYQGGEQISVRDFQNLIGRSGRSGMHTEGSILFADPNVFDERNRSWIGRTRWVQVKELLDPSKSEKCDSKLFSLFDPLRSDDRRDDRRVYIDIEPLSLVEIYLRGEDALAFWLNDIISQHASENFTLSGLQSQLDQKINIISAIESYLMANWNPEQATFEKEDVISLAKGTLAYFLADIEQKRQIEDLFVLLAENIEAKIPEIPKRIIFGKTMYGVPDSLSISNWLDEHGAEFESEGTVLELFNILWPLIANNIHNKKFEKCDQPEAIRDLASFWLEGIPFYELFRALTESGARLIAGSQRRCYKIEHIVDICENGFAYDGILVLGALIELVPTMPIENVDLLVSTLQYLQKRLKYGLPNQIAIILYEMGFADRVVAIDLSSIFSEILPDKELVVQSLKAQREEVFAILNKYPSYFSQVYENVAT